MSVEKGHRCEHLSIGQSYSLSRTVTDKDIRAMAEISGDKNPVHLDEIYAQGTIFGARIAHGLFCLGMVSNILGTKLPGMGTVLVTENVSYKKPVYIDDEITVTVIINNIIYEKDKVELSLVCTNQNNEIVLDGDTVVKII